MGVFFNHQHLVKTYELYANIHLHFINWWVFMSYNAIACCFPTGVHDDCPTWSSSPLLCVLCRPKSAFHYNAHFVIMLISLGSRNERYNEVAVYKYYRLKYWRLIEHAWSWGNEKVILVVLVIVFFRSWRVFVVCFSTLSRACTEKQTIDIDLFASRQNVAGMLHQCIFVTCIICNKVLAF